MQKIESCTNENRPPQGAPMKRAAYRKFKCIASAGDVEKSLFTLRHPPSPSPCTQGEGRGEGSYAPFAILLICASEISSTLFTPMEKYPSLCARQRTTIPSITRSSVPRPC